MSVKLRELIREVRQCKSASAERAVIAKELANIRTAIKDKNLLHCRHRNVAKLMYCDMLGYPTHFGQMEVLKLLASKHFVEKRLGYLALMQLLDENSEVLMLVTQSLKQDMCHENPFIVGLALCSMGNIASTDISRDLARELEKLLKHSNPYIRKKALCTAIRVINRVPEMCEEYFKCAVATLEDSGQGHGPTVGAVQLLYSICVKRSKHCKKLRKFSSHIISRLSSLLRSSYDPDHDIGGVTDPFLQVYLLKLLRLISKGDNKLSDDVDSTLAQIATNTESNKNPGNSILYECVRTIMSIDKQSSLHVLAINILGRFLVNRDNNVRYVALNALCNAVTSNTDAIQRHRNTIVECLKDADLTIRRRALDLIYALTNKKNIKSLSRDLLNFLTVSNTTSDLAAALEDKAPKNGHKNADEDNKGRKGKKSKRDRDRKKDRRSSPMAPVQDASGKPVFIAASSLSAGELEFRQELASKICMVVERYAPNRKWHLDTIIQVMATTTSTGFNREQEVISNLFILVSNSPMLQSYCTFKLFECLSRLQLNSDPIRQITSWLIGEYGDKLISASECAEANECLKTAERAKSEEDEEDEDEETNPHRGIENMTKDIGPFTPKSADEIVAMLKLIAKHDKSSEATQGFALTALMKCRHKYENVGCSDKIDAILGSFRSDKRVEVQQRAVEFLSLFECTDKEKRDKILKPMPVPPLERLGIYDRKGNEQKGNDSDDDPDEEGSTSEENESASESDSESESSSDSESESDSDDSLASKSDDSKATRKRKKKGRKKRAAAKEKEKSQKKEEKKVSKKEAKRQAKKDKNKAPVVPMLMGPDDDANGGGGGGAGLDMGASSLSMPAQNGNASHIGQQLQAQPPKETSPVDLLGFGAPVQQQQPAQMQQVTSGLDLLDMGMGSPVQTQSTQQQQGGGGGGGLDELLGMGSPSQSMGSPASVGSGVGGATGKIQPFEAYNKDGIVATFNFQPNQSAGVCRVLAVFHNSNAFEVRDFSFMIAVPKYIKLQFKIASGTVLQGMSQNSITQKFQLTNTLHGQKAFIIRIKVVYSANGQPREERSQVQFPDNCC